MAGVGRISAELLQQALASSYVGCVACDRNTDHLIFMQLSA